MIVFVIVQKRFIVVRPNQWNAYASRLKICSPFFTSLDVLSPSFALNTKILSEPKYHNYKLQLSNSLPQPTKLDNSKLHRLDIFLDVLFSSVLNYFHSKNKEQSNPFLSLKLCHYNILSYDYQKIGSCAVVSLNK